MKVEYGYRTLGVISGIIGLGVLLSSTVYLIQVVGYQNPGLLYGGYIPGGADYYNASYNLFGYQFNPIIAIASMGVVIGALQFLSSFTLCCTERLSWAANGWMLLHAILLIAAIVAIALGFYYEVYLYLYPANGIYYDANTGFLAPNGNPRLNGYSGYQGALYGSNGYNTPVFNGFNSGLRNLFGYNGFYNPSGQAYLGFMGIDIIFLLAGLVIVGCTSRKERYDTDKYDSKLYHNHHRNPSPATTRM